MWWRNVAVVFLAFSLLLIPAGCKSAPTTTPVIYSQYELGYRLLAQYPDIFWCDPDYYPIAREGQEQQNAIDQFATIRANTSEFAAIIKQLNLPDKSDYTDAEKLTIYREHKKLTRALQMTLSGNEYKFSLRTGQNQGQSIEGTITAAGKIKVTSRQTSFNTCPICLTEGTLIDTPDGPVAVERVREGTVVWTVDGTGNRIAAEVLETASTPVYTGFLAVRIELSDGRTITASPGHPTAEGRAMADYRAGDTLDGAVVVKSERVPYEGATYDILPAGETGLYMANGILLGSTLAR